MISPANQVAVDSRGLDDLKRSARDAPDKALRAAATQFEALFMNMVLKGMRDTVPKDGLTSSSAGDTYTGMLDQQMAQSLAGKGTGLADMLVKQLSRNLKATPAAANNAAAASAPSVRASLAAAASPPPVAVTAPAIAPAASNVGPPLVPAGPRSADSQKRNFVAAMASHAKAAEQQTGIPARFMIGQAALETGWGSKEIKDSNGQSSFNLFGIKAGSGWHGPTVSVATTEFINGVASKVVEKFRAYASYAESFADYARLIGGSPRYANVVKTAGVSAETFARGLQKAGYATDPAYAGKLAGVINDAVRIDRTA